LQTSPLIFGLGQCSLDYIGTTRALNFSRNVIICHSREGGNDKSGEIFKALAIDTTGCGDVFHAGVIYGIVRGWAAEKCLDFGAWAAALVSTRMGGRNGIPAPKELQERGY